MAVQREYDQKIDYGDLRLTAGISVFSRAFDAAFAYEGDDLGCAYTPAATTFKLWAPTAWEAYVVLYDSWEGEARETLAMERKEQGTWSLHVPGDLNGVYYTYKVRIGEQWNEAVDPYARAVGVNGGRGCVIDLRSTDPERWTADKPPLASPLDAVIYELHVRDLSIHPDSGMEAKGGYLALTEKGTRGPRGIATGVDHIVSLGVTHVQLLPVFDYSSLSVDETGASGPQYNWGYDPMNYNAPEGAYASNPYDPAVRIRELKTAIQALHDRGLRVIMDVVYNHMYDGYRANFAKLVPGYYFRTNKDGTLSDGSGCGNDLATERKMVRKFIVESVLYWAKEYRMDGFRFDLMGLIDRETMLEIRRRLDELDPSILVLGEGWIMDSALSRSMCANQQQAGKLPGIAMFNDCLRDSIKGNTFVPQARGFVNGDWGQADGIRKGVAGAIAYSGRISLFAKEPSQTINYAECHDNYTMWDKLALGSWDAPEDVRTRMHRLGSAIVLTSQGIPLIHAGQEFMRTKGGVENSYRSPDEINWLDWRRCADRQHDVWYVKELIALRKRHPAFRLRTASEIRTHLKFEPVPDHAVAFTLREHAGGDPAKHLYVVYHAADGRTWLELPPLGGWQPVFGSEHIRERDGDRLLVEGIGMVVLAVWP